MPAEIDLEDLVGPVVGPEDLPGGRRPADGAEDVVDGEKPAKDRGRDADADADGEGDDRERASWNRERNRLKRSNSRMSRELTMLREEMAEVRGAVYGMARTEAARTSGAAADAVKAAEQKLRKALADGNEDAILEAMDERDNAKDVLRDAKARAGSDRDDDPSPRGRQQRQAEQELPEATADWLKRSKWYDVNLGDEDSEIANTVFQRLVKEGFTADDPDTYDELDRRLAKRLPGRYRGGKADADDDDGDVPRTGGGSQRSRAGSGGDASRIPAPSRAEMKAAEMAGIDLANKDERARWERNRAERLSKRA